MTTATRNPQQIAQERHIDADLRQHLEDSALYGAIRNNRLVQVTWNQLTDDERRAAYNNTFDPNM